MLSPKLTPENQSEAAKAMYKVTTASDMAWMRPRLTFCHIWVPKISLLGQLFILSSKITLKNLSLAPKAMYKVAMASDRF